MYAISINMIIELNEESFQIYKFQKEGGHGILEDKTFLFHSIKYNYSVLHLATVLNGNIKCKYRLFVEFFKFGATTILEPMVSS